MEIKPDSKYSTKQWLTLLTITFFILLAAVILQLLIPLDPDVSAREAAIGVWVTAGLILFLMWIISVPIIRLWIKNLAYFIEEDRITIHKGILTKVRQNIPFRAVTDFRLRRSLYDRFLGIGAIQIQTAGQAKPATGYEGQMKGLIEWDGLLQQLRGKLEKLHPVSQAAAVTEPEAAPAKEDSLHLILEELRSIRKVLERK